MHIRRSLRRIALTAAALTVAAIPARAQKSASKPSLAGLDQYITKTMQDWKDPGLAIAVVKDDSIVLMKGYGTRTMGKSEPVDEHTMFAIGSSSKAFTATLVAMLVDQGKMKWDDPATAYLPGFQLYDPYVTRELTVRDLLTHRSGLVRGDLMWYATDYNPMRSCGEFVSSSRRGACAHTSAIRTSCSSPRGRRRRRPRARRGTIWCANASSRR